MQVTLLCRDSFMPHGDIKLHELPALLGRAEDCEVVLCDRLTSRHHCVISERDGELIVRDLGSTHGTFVNGSRIDEAILQPGDSFSVGLSTFEVNYEPSIEPTTIENGRSGVLRWLTGFGA